MFSLNSPTRSNPSRWISLACCTAIFSTAYNSSALNAVTSSYAFIQRMNLLTINARANFSYISAYYVLAAFIASVASWWLAPLLGRKNLAYITLAISFIATIIQISTNTSVGQFMFGRSLEGFANGLAWINLPLWQAEVAGAGTRGKKVLIVLAAAQAGTALSNWVAYGSLWLLAYDSSWQMPLGLQFLFTALALGFVFMASESPRWLLSRNRSEEARIILANLRRESPSDPAFESYFQNLSSVIHRETTKTGSVPTTPTSPAAQSPSLYSKAAYKTHAVRRMILASAMQIMSTLCGINMLGYWVSVSAQNIMIGKDYMAMLSFTFAIPTIYFAMSLIAIPLIDRPIRLVGGRRNLLIISCVGMAVCLLIPIIMYGAGMDFLRGWTDFYVTGQTAGAAFFTFFLLYFVFFFLGFNAVPYLYTIEIMSTRLRAQAVAMAAAWYWAFTMMNLFTSIRGIITLSYRYLIVFLVLNLVWAVLIWLFYPETAGRSLEGIDAYYRGNPKLSVFRDSEGRRVRRVGGGGGDADFFEDNVEPGQRNVGNEELDEGRWQAQQRDQE